MHTAKEAGCDCGSTTEVIPLQSPSGYHSQRTPCAQCTSWYTVKWISASLHYWWDTLWCQPRRKEQSKMTVSGMARDHLCKHYRGVINCHSLLSSPVHTHLLSVEIHTNALFCKWPVRVGLRRPVLSVGDQFFYIWLLLNVLLSYWLALSEYE